MAWDIQFRKGIHLPQIGWSLDAGRDPPPPLHGCLRAFRPRLPPRPAHLCRTRATQARVHRARRCPGVRRHAPAARHRRARARTPQPTRSFRPPRREWRSPRRPFAVAAGSNIQSVGSKRSAEPSWSSAFPLHQAELELGVPCCTKPSWSSALPLHRAELELSVPCSTKPSWSSAFPLHRAELELGAPCEPIRLFECDCPPGLRGPQTKTRKAGRKKPQKLLQVLGAESGARGRD
jgi:hypothetical protein